MSSRKTVLLVEDNEDNLIIYSTILQFGGYRVVEAHDGRAALASARSARPDLILMDVSIPYVDGLEVTRRLKADPGTRRIPIIALTAHALPADRDRAYEAGCDGYISKPAEPRFILDMVRRELGEAEAA